jgi:hypothetical protein
MYCFIDGFHVFGLRSAAEIAQLVDYLCQYREDKGVTITYDLCSWSDPASIFGADTFWSKLLGNRNYSHS